MPTRKPHRSATDQIHTALLEKGYRWLSNIDPKEREQTRELRFYSNGGTLLIMQVWHDEGCELYKALTDTVSIQGTIDAIP